MKPLDEKVWTGEEAHAELGFPDRPREIYLEQERATAAGQDGGILERTEHGGH